MGDTQPGGDIKATIQGRNSGQILIGNNNTQMSINVDHGAVLHLHQPGTQATEARPLPVDMRPRQVRALTRWKPEADRAVEGLQQGLSVELWGSDARGKTTLLRYLAHHPVAQRFAAGVAYLDAEAMPVDDLLQTLYQVFYQTRPPARCGEVELRSSLATQEALLLLDGADLQEKELSRVLNALPKATFVFAQPRTRLGEEGLSIPLADAPAPHPSLLQTAEALPPDARTLLAVMAALGGREVDASHLAAVAQVGSLTEALASLRDGGLLAEGTEDEPFALVPGLADLIARHWDLAPYRAAAASYFARWVADRREQPDQVLPFLGLLVYLMQMAGAAVQWVDVLRLGRALETAVALSGRWGAWEQVLLRLQQAAEAVGDRQTLAYALHQLGARALSLGHGGARALLEQALAIRQALGDTTGAEVTRQVLALAPGALISAAAEVKAHVPEGPEQPAPRSQRLVPLLGAVALAVLAAVVVPRLLASKPTAVPEPGPPATSGPGPTPEVEPSPVGIPLLKPAAVDFGELVVQRRVPAIQKQSVTLTNTGTGPLAVGQLVVTGPHADSFRMEQTTCQGSLAPGASCTADLVFEALPAKLGERRAALAFGSTEVPDVPLRGEAVQPTASVSPAELSFASQAPPTLTNVPARQPQERILTVTNTGTGHLQLTAIRVAGQTPDLFRVTGETCTAAPLAPKAACTVNVLFTPDRQGPDEAQLVLEHNGWGAHFVRMIAP